MIGIDIGSEFFKICIIKPGKPFSIVENYQSKLKTPTALYLKDTEIIYGTDSLIKKLRFPSNTFSFISNFLGTSYSSKFLSDYIQKYYINYDLEKNEERSTYDFHVKFNKQIYKINIEELYSLLFIYIKNMSQNYAKIDISDAYITVPSFFTYKQRESIYQSIQISGLNILGLINDNLAAAVQYHLKNNIDLSRNIIFYNMGGSYTQVSLINYNNSNINILGEKNNKDMGGNTFNNNLVKLIMKKFDMLPNRKGKNSIMNDKKIYEKILPNAIKCKEVLSSNKDCYITILGLYDNINLETMITRDEFLEANKEILNKIYNPIEELLIINNMSLSNISSIELIGGSIRIPKLQEIIRMKLGKKYENLLGIHMNGDDSVAYGAGFMAANSTNNFNRKKIFMINGANAEYKVYIKSKGNNKFCNSDGFLDNKCVHEINVNRTLFEVGHQYGKGKRLSFFGDDDFTVKITEKINYENEENEIMVCEINGMYLLSRKIIEEESKYDNKLTLPKIVLKFDYNNAGIINLYAYAEYNQSLYMGKYNDNKGKEIIEYRKNYTEKLSKKELEEIEKILNNTIEIKDYEYEKKMKELSNNTNFTSNNTTNNILELDNKLYISSSYKTHLSKIKQIGTKKLELVHHQLNNLITQSFPKPLTDSELKLSYLKIKNLLEIDRNRTRLIEEKNNYESSLYNMKSWIEKNGDMFMNRTEKVNSLIFVNNKTEWYDNNNYNINLHELENEYMIFKNYFKIFIHRYNIYYNRAKAINDFYIEINMTNIKCGKLVYSEPWRLDYYQTIYLPKIQNLVLWVNQSIEKQNNISPIDEPFLTDTMIYQKIEEVKNYYNVFRTIRKIKLDKELNFYDMIYDGDVNIENWIRNINFTKTEWGNIQSDLSINNNNSIEKTEENIKQDL